MVISNIFFHKNILYTISSEDFVEETHMTYRGSLKTSKALAHEIMDFYELPDHRGEESAIDWEGHWDTFCEIYGVENTY